MPSSVVADKNKTIFPVVLVQLESILKKRVALFRVVLASRKKMASFYHCEREMCVAYFLQMPLLNLATTFLPIFMAHFEKSPQRGGKSLKNAWMTPGIHELFIRNSFIRNLVVDTKS